MSEEEALKQADKTLAQKAWGLVWNGATPLWASLGIAVVFTLRVFVCSYEDPIPEGLDFQWYGKYCGPGHSGEGAPVDELDEACKRHDEAYSKTVDDPIKTPLEKSP